MGGSACRRLQPPGSRLSASIAASPFRSPILRGPRPCSSRAANPAETMPPLMQYFDEQRARGGKLIVVDPRRTATAKAATLHLQTTPGSDGALATGLLHVAIRDNLIDRDFVAAADLGLRGGAPHRGASLARPRRAHHRRSGAADRRGGPHHGRSRDRHGAQRPRCRTAKPGRRQRPGFHQPRPGARSGRQAVQRLRLFHRPGKRPRRTRTRPEGRPTPRLSQDRRFRDIAPKSRPSGVSTPTRCRNRAYRLARSSTLRRPAARCGA